MCYAFWKSLVLHSSYKFDLTGAYNLYGRQAWCAVVQGASNTRLHTSRYVQAEWAGAWRELTRERALWGPPRAAALAKWALDCTEGPARMRKMLRRNHLFYLHYPYRPDLDDPDNVSTHRAACRQSGIFCFRNYGLRSFLVWTTEETQSLKNLKFWRLAVIKIALFFLILYLWHFAYSSYYSIF